MKQTLILYLIVLSTMAEQEPFIQQERREIAGKTFFVPNYNLQGFEKYFLPKLDNNAEKHVYFNPNDINKLYQQKNLDPQELECNLKYQPQLTNERRVSLAQEKSKSQQEVVVLQQKKEEEKIIPIPSMMRRQRPPLREKGFTHFIHIPFVEPCRQIFNNVVKTQIDVNDNDSLVSVESLHCTILVFRLGLLDDLPKWEQILRGLKLKKYKPTIRGVGIFPTKPNTTYTRVLYMKVEGINELIHEIVSKGVSQGLVKQKELENILFDKKTDEYVAEQPHLTLIKTKGKEIIDAAPYLKMFSKINIGKVGVTQIRMSVIGSFDGKDYFDQFVIPADK